MWIYQKYLLRTYNYNLNYKKNTFNNRLRESNKKKLNSLRNK